MSNSTFVPDPASYHESKLGQIYGISIAFASVSAIVVGLRLYTRCGILRTAGADDWSMLFAELIAIVSAIETCLEGAYGLGRHSWAVAPADSAEQVKHLYINILVYNLGMNVVKISFLLQYRRILASNTIRRICVWAMAYVIAWAIAQDVLLGLACVPIEFVIPGAAAYCLNTLPIWYFSSAMSLTTDCLIFLLPLPSLWKLHLPQKQKLLVFGIFCLGFFVCIISIIRMFSLREAVITQDPSWDNTEAALWSVIELNTAILCSCLPTLRPLLARFIPGLTTSFPSNKGYQQYGSSRAAANSRSRRAENASHVRAKSISTEELALGDVVTGRVKETGVFASCSAENRSEENLVDMPPRGAMKPGHNHIVVTKEMSIKM